MIGVYAIIYLSSIVGGPTWRRGCSCSYIVGNLRTKFETSGGPEPTRDISATTSHHTDKTVAANLKVRGHSCQLLDHSSLTSVPAWGIASDTEREKVFHTMQTSYITFLCRATDMT